MVITSNEVVSGVVGLIVIVFISSGLHQIEEGYIGVYWRGGALLNSVSHPGFHLKVPLITSVEQVQVSLQTDKVTQIPCGTSGGVIVHFEKIEVVNRLNDSLALDTIRQYTTKYDKIWIFDKIHHEINQFCSSHTLHEVYIDLFDTLDESLTANLQQECDKYAPGIQIVSARVTKPSIPPSIQRNFEQMEMEKAKLLVALEHQLVVEKEAETERLKAEVNARKAYDVSSIQMEKQIMEKSTKKAIDIIEDTIHVEQQKAIADAQFYKIERLSLANQLKLTPRFIAHETIKSFHTGTKLFFEESIEHLIGHRALHEASILTAGQPAASDSPGGGENEKKKKK